MKNKEVKKIIITRPAVEAGENLGFLPGDLKEKIDPYLRPIYDALDDMIPQEKLKFYLENRTIEIAPLAYMRGRTFKNAFVIADEMQNSTPNQMKLLLTRLGEGTKIVVTGDLEQSDLEGANGLENLVYKMQCMELDYIKHVEMGDDDIVRHPAVKEVLGILSK